jgi:hypothetical protein
MAAYRMPPKETSLLIPSLGQEWLPAKAPNQAVEDLALHEMETGLAEEPRWGPMYGAAAVSEQTLAEKAMDALAPGSMLVGDRNFGVFSIAWAARQRGLGVVVRWTEARARKLAGGPIHEEGERTVRWTASRFDGRRQGGMPEGACVEGRLIAARIGRGKSKEWLYLFATVAQPREQLLALYAKRWRIETDLRSLTGARGNRLGGAPPSPLAASTQLHLRAERSQRPLAQVAGDP